MVTRTQNISSRPARTAAAEGVEEMFLATLMGANPLDVQEVIQDLQAEDFATPLGKVAFPVIAQLTRQGIRAEPAAVVAELLRRGELPHADSQFIRALLDLSDRIVTPLQLGFYRAAFVEHAHRRRVAVCAKRLEQIANNGAWDALNSLVCQEFSALRRSAERARKARPA
jgi:replicative DNA helicase